MIRSRLVRAAAAAGIVLVGAAALPDASASSSIVLFGSADAVGSEASLPSPLSTVADRAEVPEDRYALAGGCYRIETHDGGVIARSDGGYAVTADAAQAEPFHLQATELGRYLVWDTHQQFLGAAVLAGPGPILAHDEPSERADWFIEATGADPDAVGTGTFRAHLAPGATLAASAEGVRTTVGPVADDSILRFTLAEGCPTWPEVEVDVSGDPATGESLDAPVRGLLEGHMHMMAYEFLGGRARCGQPWHRYGVTYALVDCPDHAGNGAGAVLENVLSYGTPVGTHDPVGWPTFKDWPAPRSLTHEQAYYKWLERSWRGGLRVFVNLLVDNTALCQLYPLKRNSCNEMDGVRLQARRIHELQDYIDAQSGGPGEGWFRIVTNPTEARHVINSGKLAVVLGIEVSELFDCGETLDVPACTADQIDARLDEVYDMGVRQMEFVNKFDNGLAGVAGDNGATGVIVNTGNRYVTGHWWDMQTCAEDEGHSAHAHDKQQMNLADDAFTPMPDPTHERDAFAAAVIDLFGPTRGFAAPVYPEGPHCNARGLTPLGEHLVRAVADKGMIFDPDHMSVKAQQQAMAILQQLGYSGVISSHSWSADDAPARIYGVGGMVTPYAGSSAGFVDAWATTKDIAAANTPAGYHFGFGYGADMNGFGGQGGPRNPEPGEGVVYPFTGPLGDVTIDRQVSGLKTYDINTAGVAHYGLYPDWVQDLRVLAGARGQELIDDMVQGAEAYLQMWERADGVAPHTCISMQDQLQVEDLHGLGDASPDDVMALLGQPEYRDESHFTYCATNGPLTQTLVVGFDAHGRVALIELRPRH